jgi:cytochrome c oxidase subunit 3
VSADSVAKPLARRAGTANVGMAIFLGTVTMLFAALFFAYGVMRAQAPAWPPVGSTPLPRGALALNTLALLAASVALRGAGAAARRGDGQAARRRSLAALLLGAGFLTAQALVWRSLVAAGGGPASGIYGSVFFAISGFHALHVAGGLIALSLVARSAPADVAVRRLRLCGLYWDFVLAVWAIFFVAACLG